MKYICKKCTEDQPCVLDIGDMDEWPILCPLSSCEDGNANAEWEEMKEENMKNKTCACGEDASGVCEACLEGDVLDEAVCHTAKDPKSRYYDAGGVEVLDVIKAKLTPEQYKGWLLGNLIKYSCRANYKGQFSRDIEKVKFYGAEMFNFLGE